MVESSTHLDSTSTPEVIANAEAMVEAFEQGLLDYQEQVRAWGVDLQDRLDRQSTATEEERGDRLRELDELQARLTQQFEEVNEAKQDLDRLEQEGSERAARQDQRLLQRRAGGL